ncbi:MULTISPECIES: cytochrome P450 [unclassified Streptomyces]|uniref:cytochrome P450 n=1 Tax=unclassified Streptomyces TaxID=2593676 RepID=UPI00363E4EEC
MTALSEVSPTPPSAARPLPLERTCPFTPPAELGRLREQDPVSPLAYPDGSVGWLVTDHALAKSVLTDNRFSARGELQRSPVPYGLAEPEPARPGAFIFMDPPEHTRYRKQLTGQFTVRRMKLLEARIEEITAQRLAAMRQGGNSAELVADFALPIPSLVICELLGVPYEDNDFFQRHSSAIFDLGQSVEEIQQAFGALVGYLSELLARKRARPTDDLLSGLVSGSDLNDEELIGIVLLLLVAGHETTANMLALGTFALLRHPDQLRLLRDRPELTDNAVEELLRHLSIMHVGLVRAALEDVELGGRTVRAGEVVTVSVTAANHDPKKFPTPQRLDITAPANGHLAFGHGIHQCLGQQLARIEMRIGFRELLREFPQLRLAVPAEDIPMRSGMSIYGVHRLPVTW